MIKHILFDNDGTIVDSEHLAVESMMRLLKPHGFEVSHDEYHRQFPGLTVAQILDILQNDYKIYIDRPEFVAKVRLDYLTVFERELKAIVGMPEIFRGLKVPKSMVSNGSVAHVEQCLRWVGLLDGLDGSIFSGYEVARPKPFPDVYLSAIQFLGLEKHETIVVEDSPTGVLSAKSAGLRVIGFLGASHADVALENRLRDLEVDFLVKNAAELRVVFEEMGVI